jgi:anhydro-N-acetylmuramic acid kinase
MRALGLMCGTSLDGIDAAAVDIVPRANGYDVRLARFATVPFETGLLGALRAALSPNEPVPQVVARLDRSVGEAFAVAALSTLAGEAADFVASHGVTLYHGGGTSVQIGDPFVLREALQTTVVADFRRADCAAGGEGAPLVPHVDALLFARDDAMRVALNLGGIANVTLIPRGGFGVVAWDVGPANMLLDAFVRARTAGAQTHDVDGRFAARGRVDEQALRAMAADPYFAQAPPKSTGRERFGEHFLAAHAAALEGLSLEDGCATLAALTVRTIAGDLEGRIEAGCEVIVSGGGAHNPALLRGIAQTLPRANVVRSDAFGIDVDAKEALSFAMLGYETLRGRAASIPGATGARHAAVLGAIVPWNVRQLLARVDAEVREADGADVKRKCT